MNKAYIFFYHDPRRKHQILFSAFVCANILALPAFRFASYDAHICLVLLLSVILSVCAAMIFSKSHEFEKTHVHDDHKGEDGEDHELWESVNVILNRVTNIGMSDDLKNIEIEKGLELLGKLDTASKKSRKHNRIIQVARYQATFMLHSGNVNGFIDKLESIERYILELPNRTRMEKDVRYEVASFWLTKASLLAKYDILDRTDATRLMKCAMMEFNELGCTDEAEVTRKTINLTKYA
jgi:hypothetical protein